MATMTHWRLLVGVLMIASVLLTGWSCSPAQRDLPMGAAEPAESPETAIAAPSGSASSRVDEADNLGAFPAFMPPVAFGTATQECQLGTDPYSTCI